jgi:8-oxo-dGTP pyrophosphatase MutT (NUDIX family)
MTVPQTAEKKKITLDTVTLTLPSGAIKERQVVHPGHAVAMLPIEGDFCYLERQYRFAVGEWIYEVPAGTMDPGETPQETAYRELIEEIGMAADTLISRGRSTLLRGTLMKLSTSLRPTTYLHLMPMQWMKMNRLR